MMIKPSSSATPETRSSHEQNGSTPVPASAPTVENLLPSPAETLPAETLPAETPAVATARPRKKPPLPVLIVLAIGLLAGGVFGSRWWQYSSTHETTDDAQLAGHVYQVSSRVNGTVKQVAVTDNESVSAGQLLVQLDPDTFEAAVSQAQAALASAQDQAKAAQISVAQAGANANAQTTTAQGGLSGAGAGIGNAQAALTTAQAGVPVAQAGVTQAQATLENAQAEATRYADLYAQGAVSAEERDTYQKAYQVAQAQLETAQQQVTQAEAQVSQALSGIDKAQSDLLSSQGALQQANAAGLQTGINNSQYEAAQAQIAAAQASLKTAQLNLSYTQITAPAAGTVGDKSVEPGTQVQTGTPLMAIVGKDFWVMANFKETQVADIRPGEPVIVTVDSLGGETLTGKVESISPASGSQFSLLPPDNATGNFTKVVQRIPVKISLDPSSIEGDLSRLSPGMSATVSVDTSGANNPTSTDQGS